MSCLNEEQHNLGVICFCFMLIYVILKCKCAEMIGSGAAGVEIEWEKLCLHGCKQKNNNNKKTLFTCYGTKQIPAVCRFSFPHNGFLVRLMHLLTHNTTQQTRHTDGVTRPI